MPCPPTPAQWLCPIEGQAGSGQRASPEFVIGALEPALQPDPGFMGSQGLAIRLSPYPVSFHPRSTRATGGVSPS